MSLTHSWSQFPIRLIITIKILSSQTVLLHQACRLAWKQNHYTQHCPCENAFSGCLLWPVESSGFIRQEEAQDFAESKRDGVIRAAVSS